MILDSSVPADALGTGEDILDEGVEGHVPIPPDDQAPERKCNVIL